MDPEQAPLLSEKAAQQGRGRLALALVGFGLLLAAAVAFSPASGGAAVRRVLQRDESDAQLGGRLVATLADAINGGDAAALLALYSPDAVAYWDKSQGLIGFDKMAVLLPQITPPPAPWILTLQRSYRSGDVLYTVSKVGGPFSYLHSVAHRWSKSGGQWLITQDIPVWGESTASGSLPGDATIPAHLAAGYKEWEADWGAMPWDEFTAAYFHQDAVTYLRSPGQPAGDFLDRAQLSPVLKGAAATPGFEPGVMKLQALNVIWQSPTVVSVLGRTVTLPDDAPWFMRWTKTANGWKVSEFLMDVGV
eukprot:TRINITY_DN58_c0_g1_i1.p1 TRINITY_DN58_c0_g1~~TRINITY_DN58_c0_g1_i1.p1  ORF type:complete len:337 (+),score=86.45 TRINITY_DN58_c0_g1_i1:95-1012(+)